MSRPSPPDSGLPAALGDAPAGRVTRWRLRAERAADRYEELAQRHPPLGLPLVLVAEHTARQGVLLASALAFRLFTWLVPLSLLIAGVLAGLTVHDTNDVRSAARTAGITGAASQEVITALKNGQRSWWLAVIIGAALFLWATRTLMKALTAAHAHIWQVPLPARRDRLIVANSLLFDTAWLVLLALALVIRRLDHILPGGVVVTTLLEGAIVAAGWLVLSLRLPDARHSWTDLIPGCLLLGFGMGVLHAVSRVYIPQRLARSSDLYGSLGIAVVILFWLLVISELVIGAALLNSVLVDYRARRTASATEPAAE